jgi:flavin-dependent dehydrogenase
MESCDVAIVGGGVAGSATALALATKGISNVRVFEGSVVTPFRVGETIPPDTRSLLQILGVCDRFLRQGHEPCHGSMSIWGSHEIGYNDFVFNPYGHGWHLDRNRFERLLSDSAIERGTAWLTGKRLVSCDRPRGRDFQLSFLNRNGKSETVAASIVVDATGAGSSLARRLGARRLLLDTLVFIYGFFERSADHAFTSRATLIEAGREGWWYTARIPGDRLVVALGTDANRVRTEHLHVPERWFRLLLDTKLIAQYYDLGCSVTEDLIVRSAPTFLLSPTAGEGWFAVGDAASTYDPLSSQGIYKALADGINAADAIADSLRSKGSRHQVYDAEQKARFETYLANRNPQRSPKSGHVRSPENRP